MEKDLTVIVGLGLSGLSVARFLKSRSRAFAVMDTRQQPPGMDQLTELAPEAHLICGRLDQALLESAALVVVSPGISIKIPEIAALPAQKIIGDIELFADALRKEQSAAKVIAITGANAKSTVTTLMGEMAQSARVNAVIGGNLGRPALDLLAEKADWYVLELSSFQLETTSTLKPAVATILNISPDHMDRYDSFADYCAAKQRVYLDAEHCLINQDDQLTWVDNSSANFAIGSICSDSQSWRLDNGQLFKGTEKLLSIAEMKLSGLHNQVNALSALALADLAGWPLEKCLAGIKQFSGLEHRCQWVGNVAGVDCYNDSKGTNVGATEAAIAGLADYSENGRKLVLIVGGQGKGQDFSPLAQVANQVVSHVVLIGEDAQQLAEVFAPICSCHFADSMENAIEMGLHFAKAGDGLLLSPACASFDMFKSFVVRGEVFTREIKRLEVLA